MIDIFKKASLILTKKRHFVSFFSFDHEQTVNSR